MEDAIRAQSGETRAFRSIFLPLLRRRDSLPSRPLERSRRRVSVSSPPCARGAAVEGGECHHLGDAGGGEPRRTRGMDNAIVHVMLPVQTLQSAGKSRLEPQVRLMVAVLQTFVDDLRGSA